MLTLLFYIYFTQIPACDWLVRKLCSHCIDQRRPEPRSGYTINGTDMTSLVTDARGRSRPISNGRRNSGTPFVKVTLSEHDNEILLKHIKSTDPKGSQNSVANDVTTV